MAAPEDRGYTHHHGGGELGGDTAGLLEHLIDHLETAVIHADDLPYVIASLEIVRFEIDQILPQMAGKLVGH